MQRNVIHSEAVNDIGLRVTSQRVETVPAKGSYTKDVTHEGGGRGVWDRCGQYADTGGGGGSEAMRDVRKNNSYLLIAVVVFW